MLASYDSMVKMGSTDGQHRCSHINDLDKVFHVFEIRTLSTAHENIYSRRVSVLLTSFK